jgi:predicted glycoside hydrolase/deacetylase ChbG (UPF0249 family)
MAEQVRYLIVNADDFGQGPGVNRGIVAAHECGVVTSASLMVRWPAAAEAAEYARRRPELSLGLHLDLGEWTYRDGVWEPVYEVVALDDQAGVADEVARQLDAFRRLTGANPSHLDSHQHVHLREPVRSAALAAACRLNVPLRTCTPEVRYCGDFYGQTAEGHRLPDAIGVTALLALVATLPAGVTELGCHPGEGEIANTMYVHERAREVETLCHFRVRAALAAERVELCSFRNFHTGRALEEAGCAS